MLGHVCQVLLFRASAYRQLHQKLIALDVLALIAAVPVADEHDPATGRVRRRHGVCAATTHRQDEVFVDPVYSDDLVVPRGPGAYLYTFEKIAAGKLHRGVERR